MRCPAIDNPIFFLLSRRPVRRLGSALGWLLVMLALAWLLPNEPLLQQLLAFFGWLGPAVLVSEETLSRIEELRRRRILEEATSASVTPIRLFDGFVLHAGRVFLGTLWWSLPLAFAWPQNQGLEAVFFWLSQLALCLAWCGAGVLLRAPLREDWVQHFWGLTLLGCSGAAFAGVREGFLLLAAAIAGLTLAFRVLATPMLRSGSARPRVRNRRRRGAASLLPVSNAIVFRQSRVQSYGLWSQHRLFLAGMALLLAGAWYHLAVQPQSLQAILWTGLVILLALQTLRAGHQTVGALIDEREQGTLEALLATPISARQWLDGWALVGTYGRVAEALLLLPVVAGLSYLGGLSELRFLSGSALLVVLTFAAGYAGLGVSARSGSRAEALDRLGVDLAALLWLPGLGALLLALRGPLLLAPLVPLAGLVAAVFLRRQALASLGVPVVGATAPLLETQLRRSLRQPAPEGFKERLLEQWQNEPSGEEIRQNLSQASPEGSRARLLERLKQEGLKR